MRTRLHHDRPGENFTRPGLTQNVELNIQVQSPGDVAQLQRTLTPRIGTRAVSRMMPLAQPVLATIRSNPSRSNASSVVVRTFPSDPT